MPKKLDIGLDLYGKSVLYLIDNKKVGIDNEKMGINFEHFRDFSWTIFTTRKEVKVKVFRY
jgi:hypothetical protein